MGSGRRVANQLANTRLGLVAVGGGGALEFVGVGDPNGDEDCPRVVECGEEIERGRIKYVNER